MIPLLLLPGLLCDERLWRDPAEMLNDVAEPIFGDLALDDSIAAMAARALDAAPARFALAGLSMGGYVALEIMRQAPERVLALALLDTSAKPDSPERAAQRRAAMAAAGQGRFLGLTPRLLPQFIHESRVAGPLGDEVRAMVARVGKDAFLRQQAAILGRRDARPLLAGIAIPTLVGVGDRDVLTPLSESEDLHAGIAGSTLHVFSGCGHLPAMEAPEETARELRGWLASAAG